MKKTLTIVFIIILGIVAYVYLIKPQLDKTNVQETSESTPPENTLSTNSASGTGNLDTTQSDMSTQNTNTQPAEKPASSVNSGSVTLEEKEAMITTFFGFGKLLSGTSHDPVTAYIKKSHPQDSAQLLASMDLSENFTEISLMIRAFGGFEDLAPSDFRAPTTVWKKQGNIVTADIETSTKEGASMKYHAQFINQGGVWYVDMNK